ncbi:MAG TPA: type III-A CRISPR-associated protein Csm2 [Microscillaceae bacterium]|nr:type III-A CRISPR-associated protein Csm2 [Microscillaceae bacterium]
MAKDILETIKEAETKASGWINQINSETIAFTLALGAFLAKTDKNSKPYRDALTTSQLRNFFGEMRRIHMKVRNKQELSGDLLRDFLMLSPKLAYAEARVLQSKRGSKIKEFVKAINILITAVDRAEKKKQAFENFVNIIEAIVAYHKANGGRD